MVLRLTLRNAAAAATVNNPSRTSSAPAGSLCTFALLEELLNRVARNKAHAVDAALDLSQPAGVSQLPGALRAEVHPASCDAHRDHLIHSDTPPFQVTS